jgi:hypothetical protein
VGVGDRGHQVGGAGAGGRHADADFAGRLGVTGGGVAGALLVADQDVAHLDGVHQRVVRGKDRTARDAEHGVGADRLERTDEGLGARDALGGVGGVRRGAAGPRLRVVGPGGLLGHLRSLLSED